MTINMIRQGDVLLVRREAPAMSHRTGEAGLRVEGELSGHAHVLPAEVHETPEGLRLLRLKDPTPITHEEHAPIIVPAGWWEPRIQREPAPGGDSRVAD